MEERHERALAAAHLALAALLQAAATPPPAAEGAPRPCLRLRRAAAARRCRRTRGAPSPAACAHAPPRAPALAAASARDAQVASQQQELLQQLAAIVGAPAFYKRSLGAKSAAVRQAAYVVVSRACQHAPATLDDSLAEASAAVLGALGDKEPGNHGAMWEMVLGLSKVGGAQAAQGSTGQRRAAQGSAGQRRAAQGSAGQRRAAQGRRAAQARRGPEGWSTAGARTACAQPLPPHLLQVRPGCWLQVNASKAILPRLWALLRHGCHGSAATSFPALLPLLALMPAEVVGPSTNLMEHLLGSVWTGLRACSTR
jgi:hypothetical protein